MQENDRFRVVSESLRILKEILKQLLGFCLCVCVYIYIYIHTCLICIHPYNINYCDSFFRQDIPVVFNYMYVKKRSSISVYTQLLPKCKSAMHM
jgi:hypothetical protein